LRILTAGCGSLGCTLRTAPQSDQPLVEDGTIGCRRATPGDQAGSHDSLVPRERSAYNLDCFARLAVRKSARVLHAHPGNLVVDAGSIIRHLAWLSLHLDGAGSLKVERDDGVDFLDAAEH